MEKAALDTIKSREIIFTEPHPDPQQAQTASALLADIQGILIIHAASGICLEIQYDLHLVSLEMIETALEDVGFHLCNNLMNKLRRSLYYYTEEVQRAALGCPRGSTNCTQKIFISRYEHRRHGCRDQRPNHWRRYL